MCTYDLRPDNCDGTLWTVYDIDTGNPARQGNNACTGLSLADADDLADALNDLEARRDDAVSRVRPCNECRQLLHA
jgi:hypothetical protein